MITSEMYVSAPDLFQGKSQAVRDLYQHLLGELNKIGPVREERKEMSVSFENRVMFATAIIRNRSIKLILRANRKIDSPRISNVERVARKRFQHTILLEGKGDIDEELMKWLGDAYQTSN